MSRLEHVFVHPTTSGGTTPTLQDVNSSVVVLLGARGQDEMIACAMTDDAVMESGAPACSEYMPLLLFHTSSVITINTRFGYHLEAYHMGFITSRSLCIPGLNDGVLCASGGLTEECLEH